MVNECVMVVLSFCVKGRFLYVFFFIFVFGFINFSFVYYFYYCVCVYVFRYLRVIVGVWRVEDSFVELIFFWFIVWVLEVKFWFLDLVVGFFSGVLVFCFICI